MRRKTQFDKDEVKKAFEGREEKWKIGSLQIAAYVAAGGGMIGSMYAHQPADAYVDVRAGKRPYNNHDLERIRLTLCAMAEAYGLNPHNLPPMPDFHNCGVF